MNFRKTLAVFFALTLIFFNVDFVLAKGGGGGRGGGFSGGGRSFSGGSRSFSGGSRPSAPSRPAPSRPAPSSPSVKAPSSVPKSPSSDRSFSGGPSAPSVKQPVAPSKPSTTYDAAKQKAQQQESSRQALGASKAKERPAQQTTTSASRDRERDLRRDLNYQKMENRDLRQRQFYGSYYNRPIPSYYRSYNDGFNIWFWMWLMDRPRHDRDTWVYNHRDSMDPQRYAELRKQDSDLDRRLQTLEAQGVKKDSSYVPPGVDRDLMYSDEKAKQVYAEANKSSFPWGWLFGLLIFGALIYLVFYGKFFRRRQ